MATLKIKKRVREEKFPQMMKYFKNKHRKEIARVSKANDKDVGTSTLIILNNARFLAEAMKQKGYLPGLSIDELVKDALEVEKSRGK